MSHAHEEPSSPRPIQAMTMTEQPSSGTADDDDDRDDEHTGENEAPVREVDENTEAPEEFEIDDEDEQGHPEDDDADDEEDGD